LPSDTIEKQKAKLDLLFTLIYVDTTRQYYSEKLLKSVGRVSAA